MASTTAFSSSSFNVQFKGRDRLMQTRTKSMIRVSCCCSSNFSSISTDPYKILGIRPWASTPQVKKAFRKLAKQYHPDVCKDKDCGVRFEEINAAYEAVMKGLRGKSRAYGENNNEEAMGMNNDPFTEFHEGFNNDHMKGRTDQHWDYRDEWIGWEVGNWMFYRDQQENDDDDDDDETTCFEDSNNEIRCELTD
ncbi:hypothetical protein QN277_024415 [Acacia crassicarpa]|uniref:J domain-containing protein n=1 Tax=Acacia crassicarpa TaxID=499986 RepID=A0AAE1JDQ9_9FABA|nr:hypothetical protein QN277_024415 [Acacia crassicarpa]